MDPMDEDRIDGAARQAGGMAKETVGRLTGDDRLTGEGLVDQAAGAVQRGYGEVKDATRRAVREASGVASLERKVHADPFHSLLVAGAFGFALGWICRGR
jgi:uncharacterized protein YjbJ (UPF0337 family)